MSLDGVVQAPGAKDEDPDGGFAHGGWSMRYFDETVGAGVGVGMERATAFLFGSRTWRTMFEAWPERAGDPVADLFNAMPKYVVSSTLVDPGWNTTVIPGATWSDDLRALKASSDGELLVMGSTQLVRGLLGADLVDELHLMIEPVLLGGGKSIFPEAGILRGFRLDQATTSATGVQVTRYLPQ